MDVAIEKSKVYTDLNELNGLKRKAREHDPKALESAAKQFEAVFLNMMMKSMRDTIQPFSSDLIDRRSTDFFQGMQDQQMSVALSDGKQLGLAELIVEQLGVKNRLVESSITMTQSAQLAPDQTTLANIQKVKTYTQELPATGEIVTSKHTERVSGVHTELNTVVEV